MPKLTIKDKPANLAQQYREAGYWNDDTVYQLLAENAKRLPDKVAAKTLTEEMTYGEWHDRVLRLAGALQEFGVEKGDVVGVQLPNSPEFLIAFLAVSALGAATQTIHMPYRGAELQFLLTHSEAKVFIGLSQFREGSPAAEGVRLQAEIDALENIIAVGAPVEGSHAFSDLLSHEPATDLPTLTGDDAFILLYTSGTTGNPKGVPIKYCWFMSNARIAVEDWEVRESDVFLSVAPFTHLAGLWTIFLTLYTGATHALLPVFTPPNLVEAINKLKPTSALSVPAHVATLIHLGLWEKIDASSLRYLIQGGAIVPPHIAQAIEDKLENGVIIQLFGMSEIQAGCYTKPTDPPEVRKLTSGNPPRGMELKIVDDDGNELPPGEEGSLLFKGIAVFTGYLNNDAATDEAFTDDGWFTSGDTAKITESGHMVITGRVKDIINRGGIKYHPKDVEDVVDQMDGVVMSAVVPYPDDVLGERGCIFIQKGEGVDLTLEDITNALDKAGLAKYKWPERLEFIDEMPLTPTRKIVRGPLKEMVQ